MKNNNALVTFNDTDFGFSVRTLTDENGTAWFVGKDVAENLGYSNTNDALIKHVDDEDKLTSRIATSGQNRAMTMINESGVYSLIFSSKLPSAKKFKHWVTSEVLPEIRKHGMYMTDKVLNTYSTDPEVFDSLVKKYAEEKRKYKELEAEYNKNVPYVIIGKVVLALPGSITVADTAQFLAQHGYPIGRNKLYQYGREQGLLSKQKNRWNKPTQTGINSGIVNLELDTNGNYVFSTRTMITPKGLENLTRKLEKKFFPLIALITEAEDSIKEEEE